MKWCFQVQIEKIIFSPLFFLSRCQVPSIHLHAKRSCFFYCFEISEDLYVLGAKALGGILSCRNKDGQLLDFAPQFAASSHDKYCWGADKVKTSDTSARPLSHTEMLSFQHKTNAFLAKRNKIWLPPKKGSISSERGFRWYLGRSPPGAWSWLFRWHSSFGSPGSSSRVRAGQNFIAAKWQLWGSISIFTAANCTDPKDRGAASSVSKEVDSLGFEVVWHVSCGPWTVIILSKYYWQTVSSYRKGSFHTPQKYKGWHNLHGQIYVVFVFEIVRFWIPNSLRLRKCCPYTWRQLKSWFSCDTFANSRWVQYCECDWGSCCESNFESEVEKFGEHWEREREGSDFPSPPLDPRAHFPTTAQCVTPDLHIR